MGAVRINAGQDIEDSSGTEGAFYHYCCCYCYSSLMKKRPSDEDHMLCVCVCVCVFTHSRTQVWRVGMSVWEGRD